MSTQPVQLQIQVLGAQAIAQINAMAAALRGLPGGSGGVNVALNFQPLTNAINQLLAALNANTNAINNPPRPPAPAGPAPTGYGGAPVSLNAPGRMINNPAAMNALVQSQFAGAGGGRGAGGSAAANGAQAQNLQAQMFDVLTQLGGGASPMLIMIQQGPQVIQALGGVGAAVDLLKAKLAAWGISMQGAAVILGTLGAAIAAGALVYRFYARETERVLAQRERDAALTRAMLPGVRQLEDANLKLAEATGQMSAQEAAAQRIRLQGQRAVVDFANALKDQRRELYEQVVAGEKWMIWQQQFARGLALVTFLQRAATDSTIDLSREGLQQHARDIEDALDSVTNWRGSIEDARKALKDIDKSIVDNSRNVNATTDALIAADAATRAHAEAQKGAAEAAARLREQEQALAELHKLVADIMGDSAPRVSASAEAARVYADRLKELETAAEKAGSSLGDLLPVVNRLGHEYELALTNLRMWGDASGVRTAAKAQADAFASVAAALEAAHGKDKVKAALDLAAAQTMLSRALRDGVISPEQYEQMLSRIADAQAGMVERTKATLRDSMGSVASAINDPLGYIVGLDPTGIAKAVVAGLQAAASDFSVLRDLSKLFNDAAAGLAGGGGAIGAFVGDLVSNTLPTLLRSVPSFIESFIRDGLPAIIEGVAAGLPRLVVVAVEQMLLWAPRIAIAIAETLLNPATWVEAGKALGRGFVDAIAELLRALRDIVEKVLPGKQFGTERTGLFSGGGVFDTLERYTTGAIFGRADRTGLFQSEGWFADAADALSGMGRRRRRSGGGGASSDREAVVNYNFAGAALMIGADPVRALDMSRAQYDRLYRSPVT